MSFLDSCIFCKIIRGAIPCHKVLETGKMLAFMDINPLSLGHILIIPKYHGERLHDIPEEYLSDILPAARRIAQIIFSEKGMAYNILQNNGKLAHQEVDHVHFHLIPKRDANDGLGIRWDSVNIAHEELGNFAAEIRKKMQD